MERLAHKGIPSRSKSGKAYLYRAAVSRGELERRIVSNALVRLVTEFPEAEASFFVHPDPGISEERLRLLMEAVERHGKSRMSSLRELIRIACLAFAAVTAGLLAAYLVRAGSRPAAAPMTHRKRGAP